MKPDDPLQQNIRRTTGLHTLKKIRALVDVELADESYKARALRWIRRYGWLVLPALALLAAYLLGVR
ncbi:MAG: hypothetical protein Q8O64_09080 [Sideroxyarcus sp.]|nr:hypothetical protein [Sideroxyarcus sp.]